MQLSAPNGRDRNANSRIANFPSTLYINFISSIQRYLGATKCVNKPAAVRRKSVIHFFDATFLSSSSSNSSSPSESSLAPSSAECEDAASASPSSCSTTLAGAVLRFLGLLEDDSLEVEALDAPLSSSRTTTLDLGFLFGGPNFIGFSTGGVGVGLGALASMITDQSAYMARHSARRTFGGRAAFILLV